jgi:hypothetical protein
VLLERWLPFLAGAGIFVGPVVTVGTYLLDGWHLLHLGLPPQAREGFGAAIFFLSVGGLLYRWRPQSAIPICRPRVRPVVSTPQQQQPIDIEVEREIEQWWRDHFHGSEVARNTPALNVAYAAKEDLKRRLRASRAIYDRLMPDMSIAEAHGHLVATGRWESGASAIWDELCQAARDNRLRVWGRPESVAIAGEQRNRPREIIPSEHWRDHEFDALRCLMHDDDRECCTKSDNSRLRSGGNYLDLRVNRDQVRRLWAIS